MSYYTLAEKYTTSEKKCLAIVSMLALSAWNSGPLNYMHMTLELPIALGKTTKVLTPASVTCSMGETSHPCNTLLQPRKRTLFSQLSVHN